MTPDHARQIHEASLALLDNPGIRLEHPAIVARLLARGARPGLDADTLRLPRQLIDECLALCPRSFALAGRRGRSLPLSPDGPPTHWSCPGMSYNFAGEHRPFTSADMASASRLLERLDHADVVFGMALDDVPAPARDVVGLRVMAEHTSKHIRVLCFSPAGAATLARIRPIVADAPWFSVGFTAHGPLRWTGLALEIFSQTAGQGIPASINGEPMAGVSGPVTLAGAAAVGNAEILAGIVVNQILEPGRACIYNLGLAHVFDMRTAIAVTGAPENHLYAAISAAMGRFYQIPSASWVSTESMAPDPQASFEKMLGFHTHAAEGVSCIWGVGQLESELTFSPAQAVLDDQMIAYSARFRRGVAITPDTLALDVTREVGIAGSFLDHQHTLDHFRDELLMPGLSFRQRRAIWNDLGRPRLDQSAQQRAADLMRDPVDPGLDAHQIREIDRIARVFVARA